MERDNHHLEASIIAMGLGPGSSWASSYIGAAAWAGNYNALGHAMRRLEASASHPIYLQAIYHLTAMLTHLNICKGRDADRIAKSGLDYYLFGQCPPCGGTGLNLDQSICDLCGGTGRVKSTEMNRKCELLIDGAQDSLNSQIGYRLGKYEPEYTLAKPHHVSEGIPACGCYELPKSGY